MTYKKIVISMIEKESDKWINEILFQNGYDVLFTSTYIDKLENDKKTDSIYWTVKSHIRIKNHSLLEYVLEIGGTVDDLTGICCSVIWNKEHDILWMSVKETRKFLGIEKFNLK